MSTCTKSSTTYYKKIKANPLARLVKIADITDNSNKQRVLWVEDAGVARNASKYAHALELFELTEDEAADFTFRIAAPAEFGTITDERLLKFGARGDGPGQYVSLYGMDGALGQWRFDSGKGGWVYTLNMFDYLIKGALNFDIIPIELAKQEFPQAFPMTLIEEDADD